MDKYVKRVIKQVELLYSKSDDAFLDWEAMSNDLYNPEKGKKEVMVKYGLTSYQYKILKGYMT